ncbi:ATP-binding cassette domain-containing protein [Rhodococcoides kyotonense]|uniref:ABC-type multidrug transport system, ATPase and permease component n=1 Tax=Rhodococcoides kyotonense TaxID=398843 RepID=A0A239MX26_9NOCA|nr:ABC transporter ATP-binding protein [Rhodococcus kyotonensis]SNT46793.1 ABC-type multidrug transport system, ATPase and permease component [Rhodococcus kyotonensis]
MNRALTPIIRRRLLAAGGGWVVAAAAEAVVYSVLAWSIVHGWSPTAVVGAALAAVVITVIVTRAGYLTGARLAGDLYGLVGTALARAKLSWFTDANRALVSSVAGRCVPTLMAVPAHQMQTYIVTPLVPLMLLIGIGVTVGWIASAVVAVLLIASFVAQVFAQRRLATIDSTQHDIENAATAAVLEFVDHLALLRSTAGPSGAVARLEQVWSGQEGASRRTTVAAAATTFVSALATTVPLVGVLGYLLVSDVPASVALAAIVLTARASAPLDDLALAGIGINTLRGTVADFIEVATAPSLTEPSSGERSVMQDTVIDVVDVVAVPGMPAVSASVTAGSRVVLRGPSGSGKTSLLGLLMRFEDPLGGSIRLGGVPLSAVPFDDVASCFGYVPQNPVVFTGSLASNIRLGRPDATDSDLESVARQVALGPVIDRSEKGIHQHVGHAGSALSGGECQRVEIARALLAAAPILVLDEATSALDERTERVVVDALVATGATLVVVTHRDAKIWRPNMTIDLARSDSAPGRGHQSAVETSGTM